MDGQLYFSKIYFPFSLIDFPEFDNCGLILSTLDWEKTGWAIPIVAFYYAVFAMAFFYFIYSLTLQGMSITYLSLKPSNGEQSCIEIPVEISTSVQVITYLSIVDICLILNIITNIHILSYLFFIKFCSNVGRCVW